MLLMSPSACKCIYVGEEKRAQEGKNKAPVTMGTMPQRPVDVVDVVIVVDIVDVVDVACCASVSEKKNVSRRERTRHQ